MTLALAPIVLASASASRAAMLTAAQVRFTAAPASIDERTIEKDMGTSPLDEVAQALAAAKASAVSLVHPDIWVLGSDSLVEVGGQRYDKPSSRDDAKSHLQRFSGQIMTLHSAAALAKNGRIDWVEGDFVRLAVRELSPTFIESYLESEWPAISGCAGAFRVEGLGAHMFERIAGDHFTVLGMPLLPVLDALRERGVLLA